MLDRQKSCTSWKTIFCHFTQHNLTIFNNISKENCLEKPGFNNVNRPNYSSPMNKTVTNKIKHFPQLFL